eukprot:scaffold84580_cov69-Phaeocystis_antarctica.AAC.2
MTRTRRKSIPRTQEGHEAPLVHLVKEAQPHSAAAAPPRLERHVNRALARAPQPLVPRPLLLAPLLIGAAPLVLLQPPRCIPTFHHGAPPPLAHAAVVRGGGQRRRLRGQRRGNRRLSKRLARAPEAVAERPVAEPRPGSTEPPRAARRALRRRRSRAWAVPRRAL